MEQILTWWRPVLEIVILSLLVYSVLAFLRGGRGAGIVRGLGTVFGEGVIIFLFMAETLELRVLSWLITNVLGYLVIALLVIFQPELRNALVRVGQSPVFTSFGHPSWGGSQQIVKAVMTLSRERTGALLAIQRRVGLKAYIEGGVRLDAAVSAELLVSIFKTTSPLHDGATVIKGDRIVAAACLFPLSENPNIETALGTRHRAAVGVTEESDAVAIVVSEETGAVSVAQNGALARPVDEKRLRAILQVVSSEEGFQAGPGEEVV